MTVVAELEWCRSAGEDRGMPTIPCRPTAQQERERLQHRRRVSRRRAESGGWRTPRPTGSVRPMRPPRSRPAHPPARARPGAWRAPGGVAKGVDDPTGHADRGAGRRLPLVAIASTVSSPVKWSCSATVALSFSRATSPGAPGLCAHAHHRPGPLPWLLPAEDGRAPVRDRSGDTRRSPSRPRRLGVPAGMAAPSPWTATNPGWVR